MKGRRHGGAVIQTEHGRFFVPGEQARFVVAAGRVTKVPGSRLGLALVDGRVVSVLSLGQKGEHMLVCELHGQLIALSGLSVLFTGEFAATAAPGCEYAGTPLEALDLVRCFQVAMGTAPPEAHPGGPHEPG
jgi:hypothetical protein